MNTAILTINGYSSNPMMAKHSRNWLPINGTLAAMSRQDTKQILARNLRELMRRSDSLDTQVKVAQRAGIAQSTVGRLLRGEVHAQLSQIESLAEAFKVDVTALLNESGPIDTNASGPHDDTFERLSDDEKRQVHDFVVFLAGRHDSDDRPVIVGEVKRTTATKAEARRQADEYSAAVAETFNTEQMKKLPAELAGRLMQAIQRELNNDTLSLSNEREQETKHTVQHHKRSSSR
ncbi:helix-turn-helix domain-containing protein [Paraburkholderia tropica]|uniref:helix-turn-helix domain-containing protein n=1 Tax=Paraburkholderia tropica TaxID=92647 RepID=UPI00160AAC54|nr:helix-turn-helix transcriptional regulator [Paraburkholderia tropica]MBB6319266.1 transcriptional regulator with XRE-family HTH domain [Paraburkholderia tropica]